MQEREVTIKKDGYKASALQPSGVGKRKMRSRRSQRAAPRESPSRELPRTTSLAALQTFKVPSHLRGKDIPPEGIPELLTEVFEKLHRSRGVAVEAALLFDEIEVKRLDAKQSVNFHHLFLVKKVDGNPASSQF